MINANELISHCLNKKGAAEFRPFGEIPIVIKVCGKIFTEIYPNIDNYKITLKCEPFLAELLRSKYAGTVIPGYHVPNSNKKYWNTILLNGNIDKEEILSMIDHSYEQVVKKLTKAQRALIDS